jgi:hypothetical protein
VLEALERIEIADLRVTVLKGDGARSPAIAIVCDSLQQIDLGWIENSDAPIPWRAAVYREIEQNLPCVLPIFGYERLFDTISIYYWDGETDDESARHAMIHYHGADEAELSAQTLPSTMNARRPEWMIASNAAPSGQLPAALRQKLDSLHRSRSALKHVRPEDDAWHIDMDVIYQYVPEYEEVSPLPSLTLVPLEQFSREIDDVCQHGMEMGFMDIAGLCPLADPEQIDAWLASLRLGAQFLLAAQDLIELDPTKL